MKHILFLMAFVITSFCTVAQKDGTTESTGYEAAKWKTKLVDDPASTKAAAPPAATQLQSELKAVKQHLAKLDDKKREQIKYWDAGAPSYRWNQIGPKLIAQNQDAWLRMPTAWINLAIYDATILAWREKLKYKRKRPHESDKSILPVVDAPATYSYPCEHTVTAAAAAYVLAYFFPDKKDSILDLARAAGMSRINAGVQFPSDVQAGWKLGEAVAKQVIEKAKLDGSANKWDGNMNKDPNKWTGNSPFGITLATFKPIALRSPDQFRPPAPPSFEADMKEIKDFKQTFKSRSIAFYWANNGGFEFWSEKAAIKMFENNMMGNTPVAARVYTVLHTAYHDAAIAIMDAKYTYWGQRPNQMDTTFKSLIGTPPFPGYPSGHAAGAGTTAAVMSYFFPADAKEFEEYARECAESRFYAGIHFRSDNETGLKMGKELGNYIVQNWMKQ